MMTYDTYFKGRPQTVGSLLLSEDCAGGLMVGSSVMGEGRGVSRGLEREEGGLEAGASSSREMEETALVRTVG